MSFLPGRLLAESSLNGALLQNVGATLARVDRALQGFFHPSLTRRLAWDVRRLRRTGGIQQPPSNRRSLRESVGERLPAHFATACRGCAACAARPFMATATPATFWWLPMAGRSAGILDFGDMIHAPLIFEPAVAMSELLTEAAAPLDSVAAVLQGYAQVQALQSDEVELLYDIVTARHATTLLVHAWRRQHDRQGARAAGAAARTRRARCINY